MGGGTIFFSQPLQRQRHISQLFPDAGDEIYPTGDEIYPSGDEI